MLLLQLFEFLRSVMASSPSCNAHKLKTGVCELNRVMSDSFVVLLKAATTTSSKNANLSLTGK